MPAGGGGGGGGGGVGLRPGQGKQARMRRSGFRRNLKQSWDRRGLLAPSPPPWHRPECGAPGRLFVINGALHWPEVARSRRTSPNCGSSRERRHPAESHDYTVTGEQVWRGSWLAATAGRCEARAPPDNGRIYWLGAADKAASAAPTAPLAPPPPPPRDSAGPHRAARPTPLAAA
ncbi:uncharacterized protein LOC126355459 [Schistocerca gregaria]|uniref:uncharacterized protein LOC126355459 n=1 Tax=Schistocerca gregaria TaxID=7010 RepID=UPI00211DC555|nr:uncharacterized protein LOC126355459 [Schistocerca gregaria]